MNHDVKSIKKKLDSSISDLCGYMKSSTRQDIRYCYIPLINNLEEAKKELSKLEFELNCNLNVGEYSCQKKS